MKTDLNHLVLDLWSFSLNPVILLTRYIQNKENELHKCLLKTVIDLNE